MTRHTHDTFGRHPSGLFDPNASNKMEHDSAEMEVEQSPKEEKTSKGASSRIRNKQRTLVFSSRGVIHRHRHLLSDLLDLLPHSKKEAKWDQKVRAYSGIVCRLPLEFSLSSVFWLHGFVLETSFVFSFIFSLSSALKMLLCSLIVSASHSLSFSLCSMSFT